MKKEPDKMEHKGHANATNDPGATRTPCRALHQMVLNFQWNSWKTTPEPVTVFVFQRIMDFLKCFPCRGGYSILWVTQFKNTDLGIQTSQRIGNACITHSIVTSSTWSFRNPTVGTLPMNKNIIQGIVRAVLLRLKVRGIRHSTLIIVV